MRLQMHQLVSLDRLIHEPARLMIMALLYTVESADFLFLQRETGLSKGNLSVHLAKLEQAGYVRIEKTYRGKLPLTLCSLTETGKEAFQQYRRSLHHLVAATGDGNEPPAMKPTPAG